MSKTKAWAIVSACGALSAAMVLAVLLVSGHQTAHAVTGTTDPVAGQVNQVAIDMVTTGNSPGTGSTGSGCPNSTTPCTVTLLGPIDNVLANVPLNSTVVVDVIVDEIAPADGNATGYGFDLHYDPAIVSIDTHNSNFMVSSGLEPGVVPDPDTSGDWRDDYATFSPGTHLGEGILTEVGIHCGATAGSSTLTIDDSLNGLPHAQVFTRTNTNGDPTLPIHANSSGNATIYCGEPAGGSATSTPSPTPSPSPTLSPTPVGQTPSPSPTASPISTGPTPSPSPTLSPTPVGQTPSPSPTRSPSPTPTPVPTGPTASPTRTGTATPLTSPTPSPTPRPLCNTTLATSANAGASTISVVSALGCDPGDTIRISGGTANQEDVKIAGGTQPAATSLTLATALTKSHAAGDTVVEIASAATLTPSPAGLPKTGGVGSSGNTTALLLMLLLGGALIIAAGSSVFVARANRKE